MSAVWGTPPAADPQFLHDYVVIGVYLVNGQRFWVEVQAQTGRDAESIAMRELLAREGDPKVCGVGTIEDGRMVRADTYAFYLDPDKPWPAEEE